MAEFTQEQLDDAVIIASAHAGNLFSKMITEDVPAIWAELPGGITIVVARSPMSEQIVSELNRVFNVRTETVESGEELLRRAGRR